MWQVADILHMALSVASSPPRNRKPKPTTLIAACPHCALKMKLEEAEEGDVYACAACELELTLRTGELVMEDERGEQIAATQRGDEEDEEGSEFEVGEVGSGKARSQAEAKPSRGPMHAGVHEKGQATTGKRNGPRQAPAVSASPNRSASAALKELPEPAGPEVEILRTCPAYWRVSPFAFVGTTFAMLLGAGLAVWMGVRGSPVFMVGLCALIAMINAAVFAHGWLRTRATELRITNKRIIDRDGLLTRHISEVLHKDIKSVRIRQTLWQRARGIGEIAISTDGDEGPEVYMACVTEPKKVQKIIDHYRL